MKYLFDQSSLLVIWNTLKKSSTESNLIKAKQKIKSIVENDWAFISDMEDLLAHFDDSTYDFDVVKISNLFGLKWEQVCYRPNSHAGSVLEFEAMRAEDVALFLIILERIGFNVDPSLIVSLFIPKIKSKKLLKSSELEIFWFERTRHKYGTITLNTDLGVNELKKLDTFKTSNNYKVEVWGENNEPTLIEISSPKFRKRRFSIKTICPQCGYEWDKGDSDSSYNHRKEHRRRMLYLNPKPSKNMIEELNSNKEAELVTGVSAAWKHNEMYTRAVAFKREFGYDFIQWGSNKRDSDPDVNGFLFTNETGVIVGACSFRTRKAEGKPDLWKLDWIWICPNQRRKGHLTSRWNFYKQRFGNFLVTHPVSEDMKTFLFKQGDSSLLNV